MADKYYAWSRIRTKVNESGIPIEHIEPGAVVNKGNFSEGDWDYFVNAGVVRTTPFPDLTNFGGSPNEFFVDRLTRLTELDLASGAGVSDEDRKSLSQAGFIPPGVEDPNQMAVPPGEPSK